LEQNEGGEIMSSVMKIKEEAQGDDFSEVE
jgi:hypothetical protein